MLSDALIPMHKNYKEEFHKKQIEGVYNVCMLILYVPSTFIHFYIFPDVAKKAIKEIYPEFTRYVKKLQETAPKN